jgi:hypothetical protein
MVIKIKKEWKNIDGRKARLIDMELTEIPTFNDFKNGQLKSYPHLYSGYSDEKFKEDYKKTVDFSEKFNGLCKLNEQVQIVKSNRNDVIFLSKKWKGSITFHSDLEVWLWQETDISRFTKFFKCEFYEFGEIYVPRSDVVLTLLEGAGTSMVSHSYGIYQVTFDDYKNPQRIHFKKTKGIVGNTHATFEII